jgi:uncharacterized membrane protein
LQLAQINYLPLPLPFFLLIVFVFLVVAANVVAGSLRYISGRLGIGSPAALFVLLCALIGSYVNIPVWQLPPERVLSGREVAFFGMRYVVPVVVHWPGTVIAVNVGGAIVPVALSFYLLLRNGQWLRAIVATALVSIVCHLLASPVPGVGIAIPVFVPPVATAVISLLLSPRNPAIIAYVSGSFGTLIGADLLNLGKVQGLGAPVASIGGAGTFDGIFLTGLIAVLFASLPGTLGHAEPHHHEGPAE